MRAHLQRVRAIQRRVASNARLPCGSSGAFNEEEVYSDLSDFMLREGVESEGVVEQVLAFTLALAQARAMMGSSLPAPVEPHSSTYQPDVIALNLVAQGSDEGSSGSEHSMPIGTFFVIEQRRSGFKMIHRFGSCSTRPHDCFNAKLLGESVPSVVSLMPSVVTASRNT